MRFRICQVPLLLTVHIGITVPPIIIPLKELLG